MHRATSPREAERPEDDLVRYDTDGSICGRQRCRGRDVAGTDSVDGEQESCPEPCGSWDRPPSADDEAWQQNRRDHRVTCAARRVHI